MDEWMHEWMIDRYFIILNKLMFVNQGGRKLVEFVELQFDKLLFRVISIQIPDQDFKNKLQ